MNEYATHLVLIMLVMQAVSLGIDIALVIATVVLLPRQSK